MADDYSWSGESRPFNRENYLAPKRSAAQMRSDAMDASNALAYVPNPVGDVADIGNFIAMYRSDPEFRARVNEMPEIKDIGQIGNPQYGSYMHGGGGGHVLNFNQEQVRALSLLPFISAGMTKAVTGTIDSSRRAAVQGLTDAGDMRRAAPTTEAVPDTVASGGQVRHVEPLALPNPETARAANTVRRDDSWSALDAAEQNAGVKRNKSGRYVGGPASVTTPQGKTGLATQYLERVQRGVDAGIEPGYFYEEGQNFLGRITDDVAAHRELADVVGETSTQVGPYENLGYALRTADQFEMGVPTRAGIYPNAARRNQQSIYAGEAPWLGFKRERYANLLGSPGDTRSVAHPSALMPPNDQWEGKAAGFTGSPSGATQVAFVDDMRGDALQRWNRKLIANGEKPWKLEEMQEVHWAVIRADAEGRPLEIGPKDTLQGSAPAYTYQHSYETQPGNTSNHFPGQVGTDISQQDYANRLKPVMIDEQGKDPLVRTMGGRYQLPVVEGSAVWDGVLGPGFQSRSMVGITDAHGLEPASDARTAVTERMRAFALGQDASAGHILQPAPSRPQTDTIAAVSGGTPNPNQTVAIQGLLDESFGQGKASFVFTDNGYRILNTGDTPNAQFSRQVERLSPQLDEIMPAQFSPHKRQGHYDELDWEGGNATKNLLAGMPDPANPGALKHGINDPNFPGLARHADSAETRELMGQYADVWEDLQREGLAPNQKLVNVLKAWRDGGLAEVQKLVDANLAPALVLAVLGRQLQGSSQDEQAQRNDVL